MKFCGLKINILSLATPKSSYSIREYLKTEQPKIETAEAMIQEAKALDEDPGQVINAYEHVWGYFKKKAKCRRKNHFMRLLQDYQKGED